MSDLEGLFGALSDVPRLEGAKCVGKHELFDAREERESVEHAAERHEAAIHLCRSCLALSACAAWFDSLPKSKRPGGVTAARPNPMPPGRPEPRQIA
ncbi:hypothetical protein CQY21_21570 [Mycolicibacterium boenickei]|uniref:4Fe-4S Wbl-type domain-containing protein n=1 Tax=Mycolicibacterium boenickei TaxID=146017 RepID=A0ABN5ZIX2_9MYCO|nr:hypothetical protein CQY21_21570 [Mycolicibacterium boenickei]BBX93114.1 hypothetical protein MBOE_47630 [Mycolicibacterium boenickei]